MTVGVAVAPKPERVIEWSNGFPSGPHFNLNIHGKKEGFNCDPTPGGGSVFVPEYGTSEIQLIQNKKSSLSELYVWDPCGMTDPAKVQLPKGEYQVYARILAKPRKVDEERSVIFYPKLIDACNDNVETPIDGFGDFIDCSDESLIGLGVVTSNGVFDKESQYLERISPVKGNNKAVKITEMFEWSGYACDEIYDTNNDGEITVDDVPGLTDINGDLIINEEDLKLYLAGEESCEYFEHEWIFNIADLVVYGWDYHNSGSKLVQVRFYPTEETEFV
ncbi:MAG: hypothetical protein FK732_03980 [Asgard group archaeon]|nr:hypothetical protein [Asgard group archaeon]